MVSRDEWVDRGRTAIMELLTHHHAAALPELEARISDQPWADQPKPIDPHLLGLARSQLVETGQITRTETATRGGSSVPIFIPGHNPGTKRATTDAAARKRLLIARWKSWSRASQDMPNLIGTGGETVVHHSLRAAAPYGYRLVQPAKGEVETLYGEKVPGGPLDNAAWLTLLDPRTQAPTGPYLLPIEVKNVRHWLYPYHWEVHQLLHKAAGLATAHPEHPILPILICRRAHYRTRQLASDLGFQIFETHHQYVHPSERLQEDHFEEVRQELAFTDLLCTDNPSDPLVTWLSTTLHHHAKPYATRWMHTGPPLIEYFAVLRDSRTHWNTRLHVFRQLHQAVESLLDTTVNWLPAQNPPF